MGRSLGLQCTVQIDGASGMAMLRGAGGQFSIAARKLIAGSTASPLQGLIGYAPSTGAKSGITVSYKIPYSGTGLINGALSSSAITVTLGFGSAGGLSLSNAFCTSLEVTSSEGGDLEATAMFEGTTILAPGGGGGPVAADFFKHSDVASTVGPGWSSSDISSFTFRVTRTLARYVGNSATGIAKFLEIADTECSLDVEYLKTGEGATSAAVTIPLTVSDASVTVGGTPLFASQSNGSLTLSCASAFHDPSPTTNGSEESYVTERSTVKSSTGTFSVG